MTLYAIFDVPPGKASAPAAVAEKFSWFAAILPPVFAVMHGLWLALLGFVVTVIGLRFAAPFLGADASILLYVLLALGMGVAAPGLQRRALGKRGWTHRGDRVAASADLARLSWLETAR